jgi:hypothetical protein
VPSRPHPRGTARSEAACELLACYAQLSQSGRHLLQDLLEGQPPVQWSHYPPRDAFDAGGVYQWFYHSHSPEDRPGAAEHGHIHLFVRTKALGRASTSRRERGFLDGLGATPSTASTRHLITIGLTARGVPCSLFTVNGWVTGDQLLSAKATLRLLREISLDTGHRIIDRVIVALLQLCARSLPALLRARDASLYSRSAGGADVLLDESLEELSVMPLHLDERITRALGQAAAPAAARPATPARASLCRPARGRAGTAGG